MHHLIEGCREALNLLTQGDPEVWQIVFLSLQVSTTATLVGALFCIPIGTVLGLKDFKGKRVLGRVLFTLMSTPSVIVGLLVVLLISRNGPLGFTNMLYTKEAMIIAQTLLVAPLLLGLSFSASKRRGKEIEQIGKTLGANKKQRLFLVLREMQGDNVSHTMTAFSRAISEVGAVMIVGGNIKYHTRVMTTSISMLNSMGEYPMAIALGMVLLLISLGITSIVYRFQEDANAN